MYIVLFLHQTTTHGKIAHSDAGLYIVLFLHQTTTLRRLRTTCSRCISYYSYIKPQLLFLMERKHSVVYRTIPTSNHNSHRLGNYLSTVVYRTIPTSNHNVQVCNQFRRMLYIVLFLHQTTTQSCIWYETLKLYIVLFLHQTTTNSDVSQVIWTLYIVLFLHQTTTPRSHCPLYCSCISYYSYIKPQRLVVIAHSTVVVYRTIPTSNHNVGISQPHQPEVVYRTIPTSNHNSSEEQSQKYDVVYRTIPTSNHNR